MNQYNSTPVSARPAKRFSFDTVSIWALSISLALAAIFFIPATTISFLYTKIAILAIGGLIALAAYILARLVRGNIIVPPVPLLGAIWLVPFAYALSMLFSGAGIGYSFFGNELEPDTFGFMLLLALFATLTALVFRRTNQYRTFFTVSSLAYAVILLAQVIFLVLGKITPNTISPSSNLVGSFVDLGMLVGLGVSISLLAMRFLKFSVWKRTALFVGGAAGLFILALVNSTLIWILVALVALGLFIEAILRRRVSIDESDLEGVSTLAIENESDEPSSVSSESHLLAAPLIVLIVSLFFIIGSSTLGNALTTAFGTNVLDVRPSWQSTFAVGSHTYASSPIFGSGPDTFGQQWLKFRDRSLNSTVFWNVNFTSGIGLIPTSFVTEGLLGALAWIAFIVLFLVIGLRALLFRTPTDPYARFVAIASFTGILYVFALMVFEVPGPIVLVVGFAFIGIFISSLRYAGVRQEWGIIFAKNPRVGFLVVFILTLLLLGSVFAAYVVVERYLADHAYAEASVDLTAGNLTAASTDINQSILFAPSDRAYELAAEIGVAQMNQIANNNSLSPTQAQQEFQTVLSQSVQEAMEATKLAPNSYQNWVMLGTVYQTVVPLNIDGAYQNAKDAYAHAEVLDPTDPTLPYTLAQLEIAQKNNSLAEADLDQSISLKSDYTQAIFLLSQLEVEEGKAADALQAAEAAAYFDPTDPTVQYQVGILRSANGDTAGAIEALSQAVQLNPQYANAHFFLAVMYAIQSEYPQAIQQLQTVASLSSANAAAVSAYITQLQNGKNPFPPSQFGALGISQPGTSATAGVTGIGTTTPSTGK